MCGRYTNTLGPEELGKQLGERFGVQIRERTDGDPYNIAPTEHVLAIVSPKGQPQARLLRWGLVPWWAHEVKQKHLMINARMESVRSNAVYRELIPKASRRALQIADGYYEWIKPEKPGEPRQPFYFQVDSGARSRSRRCGPRRRSRASGSSAARCSPVPPPATQWPRRYTTACP